MKSVWFDQQGLRTACASTIGANPGICRIDQLSEQRSMQPNGADARQQCGLRSLRQPARTALLRLRPLPDRSQDLQLYLAPRRPVRRTNFPAVGTYHAAAQGTPTTASDIRRSGGGAPHGPHPGAHPLIERIRRKVGAARPHTVPLSGSTRSAKTDAVASTSRFDPMVIVGHPRGAIVTPTGRSSRP